MDYYIKMPGDTNQDLVSESNLLGNDNGFGVFWSGQGIRILFKMINEEPEALSVVKILNEQGKEFTITEFLEIIEPLQIRYS